MPIFLFFGEDTYSLEKKLAFWRSEFEKKYSGDINVTVLEGKETTANEIFQASLALPFLAEKRFIIVKNFLCEGSSDVHEDLVQKLEQIPDFSILLFVEKGEVDRRTSLFKKIHKLGQLTEFTPLTGSKLLGWIEREVSRRGGTIEKEAVIYLSELIASDLYRLENEIVKLVAYAGDRPIRKGDVELLVDVKLETSIFRLTDSIGQKNATLALTTLHQLIETGEDLHRILYMIMRQFRIIACVKDLALQRMSRDTIVAKLKEHPFVVSNTMSQSRNFSMEQLAQAYKLLIDMDTKLKSGGIKVLAGDNREFVLALDRLVLALCN